MRLVLCSSLFLGFLAAHLNADIVDAVAIPTGPDSVEFNFTLNGFDLLQYQVLDIRFDPSVYVSLSDPFAPPGVSTLFFNPISPTPGDFLAEALVSNPLITAGSLGIDATLTGPKDLGPLQFFVDQFDAKGNFVSVDASGMTTDRAAAAPEPAGVSLPMLGLLAAVILGSRRRFRNNRSQSKSEFMS